MIILSIDSGVEKTGYAVFEEKKNKEPRFIVSGLITTEKKYSIPERLLEIHNKIEKIITGYKPEIAVLEQLFFFHNQKTAIQVSQSQGVLLYLCASYKLDVKFLTPLQIKEIVTGYGRSDKKSVQKMLKLTLGITVPSSRDDEADAIACGLAYCYLNRNHVE